MAPNEGVPSSSQYPGTPVQGSGATQPAVPAAAPDPAPVPDAATFNAPQLLGPNNDRTASRTTVDVWNAVYHQPAKTATVSHETARPAAPQRSQAEINAEGWYSVPVTK
jgi:hypothetical protein